MYDLVNFASRFRKMPACFGLACRVPPRSNAAQVPRSTAISDQPHRFCLQCNYQLVATEKGTCPECGKAFDPADVTTFATSVRSRFKAHYFVGAVLMVGLAYWTLSSGLELWDIFDFVTAVWLAGFLIAMLWLHFGPLSVWRAVAIAFRRPGRYVTSRDLAMADVVLAQGYRLAWVGGLLDSVLTAIMSGQHMNGTSHIVPYIAASLLGIIYGGLVAELIFAPLHTAICKRRAMSSK
jgi:hypothetical protein